MQLILWNIVESLTWKSNNFKWEKFPSRLLSALMCEPKRTRAKVRARAKKKTMSAFLYALICTIKNVNRFKLRLIVLYDNNINGSDSYIAISFSTRSFIKFSRFTSFAYISFSLWFRAASVPHPTIIVPHLNRTMRNWNGF